jgi:N-acetylmuramoyl-L-alanine amidase
LVVVLDAGHGGKFPHDGAHGAHGLLEKNIALTVAQKTKLLLEAQGATVLLTRENDDDVSLADRARVANEAGADLFLSIHCNSMETRADRQITRGVETYFLSPDPTDAEAKMLAELENGGPEAVPLPKAPDAVSGILADLALGQARNDSAALAEIVQHHVIRGTWAQSRGVRQAPFLVLSGTKMPSALVEIGFISHPAESKLLAKPAYQDKVALALSNAVREFADRVLSRRLVAQVAKAEKPAAPAAIQLAPAAAEPPAAVNAVARPDGTR